MNWENMTVSKGAPNEKRKLEAVVDAAGRITAWKCSACKWSKLPESPFLATENTKTVFSRHVCEEHGKKRTKQKPKMKWLACAIWQRPFRAAS